MLPLVEEAPKFKRKNDPCFSILLYGKRKSLIFFDTLALSDVFSWNNPCSTICETIGSTDIPLRHPPLNDKPNLLKMFMFLI